MDSNEMVSNKVGTALEKIRKYDQQIRAWTYVNYQHAPRKRYAAQTTVPFGVKDIIDVAGMPTCFGIENLCNVQAARRSATAVVRLNRQGMVPIGKTVTTLLTLEDPGPTRNPIDLSRSPGGSSSGSAAAVSAAMVPIALSTQTLGSTIRPASYCGVWAFLPTRRIVPRRGVMVLSKTLDRVGMLAANPDYLRIAGSALIAQNVSFNLAESCANSDTKANCHVGFINSPYWSEVSETTLSNLKNHIDCSGFSFDCIDAGLDFEYIKEVAITIANFEICASFRTLQKLRKVVASELLE